MCAHLSKRAVRCSVVAHAAVGTLLLMHSIVAEAEQR